LKYRRRQTKHLHTKEITEDALQKPQLVRIYVAVEISTVCTNLNTSNWTKLVDTPCAFGV